jgi:hypothetical protein
MILGLIIVTAGGVNAELLGTFSITPGSPHFEAHNGFNNGHTHVGDPDIWSFDFSSFATSQVSITLKVDDFYTPYPDDYNLYWDGSLLGNTISPYDGHVFNFNTASAQHSLLVEYANIQAVSNPAHFGGSYYDLWLDAVPVLQHLSRNLV